MSDAQVRMLFLSSDFASQLLVSLPESIIVVAASAMLRCPNRRAIVRRAYAHEEAPNAAVRWRLANRLSSPHPRHCNEEARPPCIGPLRLDPQKAHGMRAAAARVQQRTQDPVVLAAPGRLRSSEHAAASLDEPSKHSQPRRLMLIVDHPGLREAMGMLLRVEGYQVIAVASLEEARTAVHDGIDLVLTDHYLRNGQSGAQVIAALRHSLPLPVKVVLMTWRTTTVIHAMQSDPDLRLVSNPLYPEALLRLVRELITDEQAPRS